MATHHIDFQPVGRRGECQDTDSLLDCARQLGAGLSNVCGGKGKCQSCKVKVVKAFTHGELGQGWRLACQAYPKDDCRIEVPPESMTSPQRTQVEGLEIAVAPDPPVRTFKLKLSYPTLSDARADADRLLVSLKQQHGVECSKIDGEVLTSLSPFLRSWNWECRVALRSSEVISISPLHSLPLGLAIDLGSTKIAAYLVSLEHGKTLASKGAMNPQISYGEDIISRMDAVMKSPLEGKRLQELVVDAINELAQDLCKQTGRAVEEILETVLVGNTAMHHLFLGLPVAQLALAPYVPAASMALDRKARDLGLRFASGAYVHLLPNIAGYVGGDHVAVLLSLKAAGVRGLTLALDIGTNTEVSLIDSDRISSVSCASGPAFEGYQIKHGMRAGKGAIEKVRISDGEIQYQTIDAAPPVGICGSGVLDILAEMYSSGIVDKGGRILEGHPRVRDQNGYREFVLIDEKEMGGRPAIVVTQEDIRHLQLAKAAIRTGIQILLDVNDKSEKEIDNVIIAGAFGSYIDLSSAITIGMLPNLPLNRYRQVGNAAGTGARLALISSAMRAESRNRASQVHYVELGTAPQFNDTFIQACYLGELKRMDGLRKDAATHG
jgi:uncharacterized 2Fe-2S/4Fe-4S cluster protein (DUF4445 family)